MQIAKKERKFMHGSAWFCAYDFQVSCSLWNRSVSLYNSRGTAVPPYLRGRISGYVSSHVTFLHLLYVKIQRFLSADTKWEKCCERKHSVSRASLFQLLSPWCFYLVSPSLFPHSVCFFPVSCVLHISWIVSFPMRVSSLRCRGTNCIYDWHTC